MNKSTANLVTTMVLITSSLIFISPSLATTTPELTDKNAILSIIGEAENQHQIGMLAVACAIKNRNSLHGVYGLHAPRVVNHKYTASILTDATKAWYNAQQPTMCAFIKGANGWENTNAFGSPSWVKYSTKTVTIGSHNFYKQNTKRKV